MGKLGELPQPQPHVAPADNPTLAVGLQIRVEPGEAYVSGAIKSVAELKRARGAKLRELASGRSELAPTRKRAKRVAAEESEDDAAGGAVAHTRAVAFARELAFLDLENPPIEDCLEFLV